MPHDPFEMPEKAFEPFFIKRIAFSATRGNGIHRGTAPCSIFDEGRSPVIDDETGTESTIGLLGLYIRKIDWAAALSTPPQQGDVFTSPTTGISYAVKSVSHFSGDTWSIEAREVAT